MAEYTFDLDPRQSEQRNVSIDHSRRNFYDRYLGDPYQMMRVKYEIKASGNLTTSHMSEIEMEAARRGVFSKKASTLSNGITWTDERVLEFDDETKMTKLDEIEAGSLATQALFIRNGQILLDRKDMPRKPNEDLDRGTTISFAGNLAVVRHLMFRGVEEEYRKDGEANDTHFIKVAKTATRMQHEIEEAITPSLKMVHNNLVHAKDLVPVIARAATRA